MNWKREAENDLKHYVQRINSLDSIKERIQALEYQREGIKAISYDSDKVKGGLLNPQEEKQINIICEIERLKLTYQATKILVDNTNRGLSTLDEIELKVIDRFYINRIKNHVENLMIELSYEKSHVYRIKDTALYKFTIALYGIIDY